MQSSSEKKYDKIIIGGGPAGLMAGITAKRNGQNILILEKNNTIGMKLSITGKGRCNITNYTTDIKGLVTAYRKNGKFLFHAFSVFDVEDTIDFFSELGIKTKTERGRRVFPQSNNADEVVEKLRAMVSNDILYNCNVTKFLTEGNKIIGIETNKGVFSADKYILTTGGKSYPLTGSNGDGYNLAKDLGHKIVEPKPALVPIFTTETWVKELAGLTLKNSRIDIYQNNKKIFSKFGELLFTHQGLTGPIIIDSSREIGDLLEKGNVKMVIDLKPALSYPILKERINNDLTEAGNKAIKNSLSHLLPSSLIPVIINLCNINSESKASQLSKDERNTLLHQLKELTVNVSGIGGWYDAIVTDGGIDTKEIDPNTMKSKLIDNLYFAGEIIDVYGPTGGYNLQLCWSTGYLAGKS